MSLRSISSQFDREYEKISRKALREIIAVIDTLAPAEVPAAVRAIYRRYGLDKQAQDVMLEFITRGAAFGVGRQTVASPAVFRKVWLNKVYDADGVTFSRRLNDYRRHDELIATLRDGMRAKQSWSMVAQDVFDKGIQRADVAKDVQALLSQARKAYRLSDNQAGYMEYRREVAKVQRRIDRLVNPDKSTLKRAYQNVVDITNKSSAAAVESAAKHIVYFKQKYNAERLAHTEISRAYGQARIVEMQADDDVIGVRSVLNSGHTVLDICDYYAEVDAFGMGPGVSPKNHMPPYPYHPWCTCKLEDVYRGEAPENGARDFDQAGGARYLKSLPAEQRRELLGRAGAREFSDNPKSWSDNLRGYNKPEAVKAKIKPDILYKP